VPPAKAGSQGKQSSYRHDQGRALTHALSLADSWSQFGGSTHRKPGPLGYAGLKARSTTGGAARLQVAVFMSHASVTGLTARFDFLLHHVA